MWRKFLLPRGQRKVRFSVGRLPWKRFYFSDRRNEPIFRAYPSTLKIAELCFEILQFIRSAALSAYSLFEDQTQVFVGVLPLPLIFDPPLYIYTTFHYIHNISQRNNAKNCFRITGYSVKIRSQVQTITRAILPRNQSPSVSNSQRGWSCEQIFDSSTTFLNPLVQNELIVWKTDSRFFSLASHALRACEARARLLRHALPISLLIFGEKKRLFCSLVLKRGLGVIRKWPVLYQKYIIC